MGFQQGDTMKCIFSLTILFFSCCSSVHCQSLQGNDDVVGRIELTEPCTLTLRIMDNSDGNVEKSWYCRLGPADGGAFVAVPPELDLSDAVSGETTLFSPGLAVVNQEAVIEDPSVAVFGEGRRRERHLAVAGDMNVVVVRITCDSDEVTKPLSSIIENVFADAACLKTLVEGCSNGKVRIHPGFDGSGKSGGVEVKLTSCGDFEVAENQATAALSEILKGPPDSFPNTYFMYCMPPTVSVFGGYAYAYANFWLSVYSNDQCGHASTQVHELGHNFNLDHASHAGDEYGDQTGMMGYSYFEDDTFMCYNAPNMYQLGWLNNVVELTSPPVLKVWKLVGHTNFGGGIQSLLLRGTPSGQDTYIWFNHKSGFHADTQEAGNQVIVTTRPSGLRLAKSQMVAMLIAGNTYSPTNKHYFLQVERIRNGVAQISLGPITTPKPTKATVPKTSPKPTAPKTPKPPKTRRLPSLETHILS